MMIKIAPNQMKHLRPFQINLTSYLVADQISSPRHQNSPPVLRNCCQKWFSTTTNVNSILRPKVEGKYYVNRSERGKGKCHYLFEDENMDRLVKVREYFLSSIKTTK